MWPKGFQERLQQWCDLRDQCASADLPTCLSMIDEWWAQSPWQPYYLHWDDRNDWPGPWDLLADNIFCNLAKALGIVYTIMMLSRNDITSIQITETDQGNLVLINQGKYILNWIPGQSLNISSTNIKITKTLDSSELSHFLG